MCKASTFAPWQKTIDSNELSRQGEKVVMIVAQAFHSVHQAGKN